MAGVKGRSGGARVNAGRPRKGDPERALDGGASHRRPLGRILAHPNAATGASEGLEDRGAGSLPVLDESDAPNDLLEDERAIWLELAPFAMANGRLRDETAMAFRELCKHVALKHRLDRSVLDAASPAHRGMMATVRTELLSFGLLPSGARAGVAEPAVDPLEDKYFGSSRHSA